MCAGTQVYFFCVCVCVCVCIRDLTVREDLHEHVYLQQKGQSDKNSTGHYSPSSLLLSISPHLSFSLPLSHSLSHTHIHELALCQHFVFSQSFIVSISRLLACYLSLCLPLSWIRPRATENIIQH